MHINAAVITRWWKLAAQGGWPARWARRTVEFFTMMGLQAGSLKVSPLVSTAHAMRAFFAAMATAAFQ